MGCLAPRLVEGPTATSSLSSESLELETAFLAFFKAGGLAGGDEQSDGVDFLTGLWPSLGNSEPDVG